MATRVLCVTLDGLFFLMLCSDTRAMGRFLDVVCYDLSGTRGSEYITWGRYEVVLLG